MKPFNGSSHNCFKVINESVILNLEYPVSNDQSSAAMVHCSQ